MKKLMRLILIVGLLLALALGVDWEQTEAVPKFDITPYLNSPSDKPGSGPKKGPPYTP